MKYLFIVFTLVQISCGDLSHFRKQKTDNHLDGIIEQNNLYLELLKERVDEYNFPITSSPCDSLLFAGLARFSGFDINLLSARDEATHRWYRTPYKDCFEHQRENSHHPRKSSSSISRDMFAGLLWGLYQDNIPALEELIEYGKDNNWIMGEGSLDTVYFTTPFQRTLYILVGKEWHGDFEGWIDPFKDHQRHVVALNILLRGKVEGFIDESALALLERWRDEYPENALYEFGVARYTNGEQARTISLLDRFPKDRLPDNTDWKAEYLWMRDSNGPDWHPTDEIRLHPGVDFLFISRLLIDSQR